MQDYINMTTELQNQQREIIKKGGKVITLNEKPTPKEITLGIQSITAPDFTSTTATVEDVVQGKTFYSGNSELKTGSAVFDKNQINDIFMVPELTVTNQNQIYYAIPSNIKNIRKYCFYRNSNSVEITFNSSIERIDEYCFHEAKNFTFKDFDTMTNLKYIGPYAFSKTSVGAGIHGERLPNTVYNIGSYAFAEIMEEGLSFKFPDGLTSLGQYCYTSNVRKQQHSLDLSNYTLYLLSPYTFYYNVFDSDLNVPETVVNIGDGFNYNGCFKNITLPASLKYLGNYCFGAAVNHAVSDYYLKTVTFVGETPPTTVGNNCFALQNKENGFAIYVPDNSLEEYKAIAKLNTYIDYIFPMSQKP